MCLLIDYCHYSLITHNSQGDAGNDHLEATVVGGRDEDHEERSLSTFLIARWSQWEGWKQTETGDKWL